MRRLALVLLLSCEPPTKRVETQVVVEEVVAEAGTVTVTIRSTSCATSAKRITIASSDPYTYECLGKLTPRSTVLHVERIAGSSAFSCGSAKIPNDTLGDCGLRGATLRIQTLGTACQ